MSAAISHMKEEIDSQPQTWRQAAELAGRVGDALPVAGERVAVIGCGSSWFAAQAYAALRESAGFGETDAVVASEFPRSRGYDRVLAITRSGTTTEVIDVLRALDGRSRRSVITAVETAPVHDVVEDSVPLTFADERSVVQTRSMTSAVVLLRAHLGEDVGPVLVDAERALGVDVCALTEVQQMTFLGRGWTIGLANEAALKTREAAQFWAEAYPAMDYRHGPISIAEPGRAVWTLGDAPPGLRQEVESTGATWVAHDLDPLAALVVAQRLALELCLERGLDPDRPRHLTRSVMLDA